MKKTLKKITIICISLIVTFLIHREITTELIYNYIFITNNNIETIVHIGAILIQFICFYLIIREIINQRVDKLFYKTLWFCYFIVLSFLLFGRARGLQGFQVCTTNPLHFIENFESNKDSLIITIMNILFFIPIGYLFRQKRYIISTLIICLSIESIQYIFSLGIFDICDIIFNIIGFFIGYLSCKNKNFNSITVS